MIEASRLGLWECFLLGACIGSVVTTVWHWRYHQRVVNAILAETQRGLAGLNAHNDHVVRGLIERIRQLEEAP